MQEEPPCLPNLALSDSFLFAKLKLIIKKTRFEGEEATKRVVMTSLKGIPEESFQKCIEAWLCRMGQEIRHVWDYSEPWSLLFGTEKRCLWHLSRYFSNTPHIYIYIYIYIYHHHHVLSLAQISLTLSRHFSLSFIASGRSSGLYPVSSHSCCMYVRAGRPAFAWPYAGVHRSTSLMSSSLLLQLC